MRTKTCVAPWHACVLFVLPSGHALSQEPDSTTASQSGLTEVTVMAQRREENLQNVPVSVSALTAESLQAHGVADVSSLAAAVPALTITRVNNGATPFLRGIGTGIVTPGEDPSVAIYVDGVYLPAPQSQLFSFNNIERVEVAKGPQGTLFGRNATGGVIQVITRDPSSEPRADISVGYGNYEAFDGSFYGTTPVTENLMTDLAFIDHEENGGWGRNAVTGEKTYTSHEYGARNKWLWNAGDDTDVRLSMDYTRSRTQSGLPVNFVPGAFGFDGQTTYSGFYNVSGNPNGEVDTRQGGIALPINHDLGWARLISITSWRNLLSNYFYDQDGTPTRRVDLDVENKAQTYSQELQLQAESERLKWIVGAFYLHDVASQENHVEGLLTGTAAYTESFGEQTTASYSGFGQGTLSLLPRTNLTIGLRYTSDKRDLDGWTAVGPTPTSPAAVRTDVAEKSKTFSKATWRISLDQELTSDVMGYVSYNRGFKAGLWNTSNPTNDVVRPEVLDAYEVGLKSEWFGNRLRLNGSAFLYDFNDIHVDYIFAGNNNILNAAKAEIKGLDLEMQAALGAGFTLQGGASYTDGTYKSFTGAPSYRVLPTGGAALTFIDATGNETVRTPKYTANLAATYEMSTPIGNLDWSASASYSDGFYWQFDNNLRQPSYTLVGASVRWTAQSEAWGIKAWGRNLLDKELAAYARIGGTGAQFSPAPPRQFGITLNVNFR